MEIEDLEEYIKQFSEHICDIDENKDSTFVAINEHFEKYKIIEDKYYGNLGRVWILIGKKNDEVPFESLMIAQSEDIYKEILADVSSMYNMEYIRQKEKQNKRDFDKETKYNLDVIKSPQISGINTSNSKYLYQKGHEKLRNQYLYRKLKKTYKFLKIYEVDIDKYLEPSFSMEKVEKDIYMLAKDYYAESKLAVETKPLYWNYYKSGIGKRAYLFEKKE